MPKRRGIIKLRTKNHSARPLRDKLRENGTKNAVVRLGSLTPNNEVFANTGRGRVFVEINTVEAIQNSRSKLNMKARFAEGGVKQAEWYTIGFIEASNTISANEIKLVADTGKVEMVSIDKDDLPYPILAKKIHGFKGKGMVKIDSEEELIEFFTTTEKRLLKEYYFENFYNYACEYRLHVANGECFLAYRKMRKRDAEDRHYFNNSNCIWARETNPEFNKPKMWSAMVKHAVRCLAATGLDIGACDVRVQSNKNKGDQDFIVCEINSAPALADEGNEAYYHAIMKAVDNKYIELSK